MRDTCRPPPPFSAYLVGVCVIATGLTFLETIANPYTTVLGDPRYAATRINLAQSCNGVGWIFGPVIGSMFFYSKDAQGVSTGSQTIYIPYVAIAAVVAVLAVIFYYANVPDIKAEDDYHLDDAVPGVSHSIWSHPHFVLAVAAQFLYVAAQAGIFSFFINYMTTEVPPIPVAWDSIMTKIAANAGFLHNWLVGWFAANKHGVLCLSDKGAANLASVGFIFFLFGRFTGAGLLKKFAAHKILAIYATLNVGCLPCNLLEVGLAVGCLRLPELLFYVHHVPDHLCPRRRAKKASAFIVMAIMGGAVLPKVMGYIADTYDMSRGFVVPMVCFAFVAFYGFCWPKLSKAES